MNKKGYRHRWHLVLLLSAYCSITVLAQTEKKYQQELDNIGQKISKVSQQLNNSKAQLKTEQDRVLGLEQKISLLNTKMRSNETQIQTQQIAIKEINQKIDGLHSQSQQDREALAGLIRQRYIQGSENYLKMILNQQNPYAVGRLQNYYNYFSRAQQSKLQSIEQQAELLQSAKSSLAIEQAKLSQRTARLNEQQASLSKSKRERAVSVEKLRSQVAENKQTLRRLTADRKRLNSLLKQLAIQAEELRKLDEQRRQQQTQENRQTVKRVPVAGGFKAQRGRLKPPVKGSLKYRYGKRLSESGMLSEGIFFNTDLNQAVRSVFRGRVLFADFLKGYGLLLIIDHGDEHISLYGHNELLYKKVGDMVETDELVARSGISGGLQRPGLYFEIRQQATPVDPAIWCQL